MVLSGNIKSGVKIFNVTGELASPDITSASSFVRTVTIPAGTYSGTKSVSLGLSSTDIATYYWLYSDSKGVRFYVYDWYNGYGQNTTLYTYDKTKMVIKKTNNTTVAFTNKSEWYGSGGWVPSVHTVVINIDVSANSMSMRVYRNDTNTDIQWKLNDNFILTICCMSSDVRNLVG